MGRCHPAGPAAVLFISWSEGRKVGCFPVGFDVKGARGERNQWHVRYLTRFITKEVQDSRRGRESRLFWASASCKECRSADVFMPLPATKIVV